jgi:hypothetical protein
MDQESRVRAGMEPRSMPASEDLVLPVLGEERQGMKSHSEVEGSTYDKEKGAQRTHGKVTLSQIGPRHVSCALCSSAP